MIYVVNKKGYFFSVACEIDKTKLPGCTFFDDIDEMYEFVTLFFNDDAEGNEIDIEADKSISSFQFCEPPLESVEDYILNFEM